MALIDDLVSYWTLDEASGTRADSHGSNTLQDNNTVLSGTGIINSGADFETSNTEFLSITDAAQSGLDLTGDFSISMWVSFESLISAGTDRFFIGKWGAAGSRSYCVALYNVGGDYRVEFLVTANGTNVSGVEPSFGYTPTLDQLYHIVVTYDNAGIMEVFVDGTSIGSTSGKVTSVANTSAPFYIGGISGVATKHDGIVDEVGVWSRVLSGAEVTELYNGGAGLAYPFTGGGAATVYRVNNLPILGVG